MHDAGPVGVHQGRRGVRADPRDEPVGQLPAAAEGAEGVPLDQLGDEEGALAVAGELVEGRDVAMGQPGDRLRLSGHPRRAVLAVDHLDGDRALQALVPGAVDGAEAAAADPLLDPESAQDSLAHHGFSNFGGEAPLPACGGRAHGAVTASHPLFILVAGLAFLDEEQDDVVVADEPERPRRRVGGPQRRRQQFLVRRLIGVGVGLAFLILIVIGIRGCLQARSDRALRNYDSSVATIMQQSEQSGKDFFQLLDSPSGSSSVDVQNQVLAQRDASSSLLDRAQSLSVPGQMHDAQSAVEQTLTLRRNALSAIASNVTQAAARTQTADAITTISNAMGSLYASDILWTQIGKPDIQKVLKDAGVDGQPLPPGNFMPANATDYLNQTTLVTKLNAITGTDADHRRDPRPAARLDDDRRDPALSRSTTNVPATPTEIDIGVTNSGNSDETGISVNVTIGGSLAHRAAAVPERRPVGHDQDPADDQAHPGHGFAGRGGGRARSPASS